MCQRLVRIGETGIEVGEMAYLAGLVLRDLVLGVLLAVLALAVGAAGLWNVDLCFNSRQPWPSLMPFECSLGAM